MLSSCFQGNWGCKLILQPQWFLLKVTINEGWSQDNLSKTFLYEFLCRKTLNLGKSLFQLISRVCQLSIFLWSKTLCYFKHLANHQHLNLFTEQRENKGYSLIAKILIIFIEGVFS